MSQEQTPVQDAPGATADAQCGRQVSMACLLPRARVRAEGKGGGHLCLENATICPPLLKQTHTHTLSQTQIPSTCFGGPSQAGRGEGGFPRRARRIYRGITFN